MVQILRQGELGRLLNRAGKGPEWVVAFRGQGVGTKLSSNTKYSGQMVCFCDIPVDDLPLHMKKYSRFGLAFSKAFLIGKGATPVFYVSQESLIKNSWTVSSVPEKNRPWISLKEVFDSYDEDWSQLLSIKPPNPLLLSLHLKLQRLLDSQLKFFDNTKDEQDDEHYYMEREWRVMGTVPFTLDDVVRIILPPSFAKRFRQDFPEFYAQLTFSESI